MNPLSKSDVYEQESAADLFASLRSALAQAPRYAEVYQGLKQVFHLFINQQTRAAHSNFCGPFAKTDYLLQEHQADPHLRQRVNDTRIRLGRSGSLTDTEMHTWYLHDLKSICQFVALVFRTDVPSDLRAIFPHDVSRTSASVLSDYVRAIVDHWDEHFVFCRLDIPGEDTLTRVAYGWQDDTSRYDWSYMQGMFYEGAQLNLVRPRMVDDALHAELIIFEPDYLVDISTVARCFESYAESPYVNLVKKLQPSAASEPIVLGNFASQLLDEELRGVPDGHTYADSVMDFFKTNALALLTADVGGQFHQNARLQRQHISEAIGRQLPSLVSRFDPRECIVEPSFFCEMLGIQGRMDMLQLDHRVLIEQKAGKGEYPQGKFEKPRPTEQHYVQLLLYMAVLRYGFREQYERNKRELHAFLLYSKYSESLLGLGYAPELLYRAIKVRNGIAWTEMQFAHAGGLRILERITPEMLNKKGAKGTLWERYTRPQLERLLSPIRQATPLERDYYFRFLTFIAGEHMLSKLGNKTKEDSGFAAKWHNTLDEKLQTGNIYDRLTLLSPAPNTRGNVDRVVFAFSETEDFGMSNFRIGDIVAFYSYERHAEPDIRRSMVFRGSIEDITGDTLTILLRAAQTNALVFCRNSQNLWAVEHDFMESSYGAMYRGMHSFLSAPKDRRDLILLQRPPRVTAERGLRGDYGDFNTLSQRVKAADELFLIIGPPGTGKTSFGMLNTLLEQLSEPDTSVLILSFTNRAVDEICSKLTEEHIDFLRLGRSYNTPEAYRPYLLENKIKECVDLEALRRLFSDSRVVVATTTSLNANIALLQLKSFALAIIDEASQILEPDLVGIFSAHTDGRPSIAKFVLIGDHKQLPAVVQQTSEASGVSDPSLLDIGLRDCRSSLFERMLWRYGEDPAVTYMLTRQGRMHPNIASFVNEAFYNGRLGVVPLPHQREDFPATTAATHGIDVLLTTRRLTFIDAPLPERSPSDKVNSVEASMIAATVERIYRLHRETFDPLTTVGVIVPYRNQIAAVRAAIETYGIESLCSITIDTVERYQGSQRDYILYGFTVQRPYQLNFLTDNTFVDTDGTVVDRKLNVALTRAKRGMMLFGHTPLLRRNATFNRLINFLETGHNLFSSSVEAYADGSFLGE